MNNDYITHNTQHINEDFNLFWKIKYFSKKSKELQNRDIALFDVNLMNVLYRGKYRLHKIQIK